ncbi:MAG: biopolymer transporter ExbD [Deltaproteobacteria bacterium]|nr:biopolymer transporter ExbD [Deltaproteobacteria bacterium]
MSAGKGDLNAEINVTPLVDVMLVLLIIFMVTAPMMQTGVDLELPQAEASILPDEEGKLILSIDKKGALFLGSMQVPWEELEVKLSTNAKVKADRELFIEADTNLPYGMVLKAMATARKAGISRLMMLTDPLEVGGK